MLRGQGNAFCNHSESPESPQTSRALAGRAQDRGVALRRSFDRTLWQPNTSSEYTKHKAVKAPARRDGLALARRLRLDSGRGSAFKMVLFVGETAV